MSIEIPMRREGNHLVPVDQVAAEMLAEVPTTTGVMVTVKVPRNLRQFRLAWALADIVSKSVDFLTDRESAMDWLKIKSRHVRMIHDPLRGTTAIVPKSISFASLDQAGFARVLNRMIYVTTTDIIPGLEESALRAELEKIVGIEPTPDPEPEKPKRTRAKKQPAEGVPADAKTDGVGPSPEPSGHRPPPQNSAEYVLACRGWMAQQTNRERAFDYYESEAQVSLRASVKLSVGENKMLRRELSDHFDKQKAGQNGNEAAKDTEGRGSADNDQVAGAADQESHGSAG